MRSCIHLIKKKIVVKLKSTVKLKKEMDKTLSALRSTSDKNARSEIIKNFGIKEANREVKIENFFKTKKEVLKKEVYELVKKIDALRAEELKNIKVKQKPTVINKTIKSGMGKGKIGAIVGVSVALMYASYKKYRKVEAENLKKLKEKR